MSELTPRAETLGTLAARQTIVIQPLRDDLDKYGEDKKITSYTRQTPFGNYLMRWEARDD